MSLEFKDVKKEAWRREQRLPPRADYHCHISMIEYADIENTTLETIDPAILEEICRGAGPFKRALELARYIGNQAPGLLG